MRVTIKSYNAVAAWKWDTSSEPHEVIRYADPDPYGDDDDDEVCGICQAAFESCCPDCKVPGDDCPLSKSSLYSSEIANDSLGRMYAYISHALPT